MVTLTRVPLFSGMGVRERECGGSHVDTCGCTSGCGDVGGRGVGSTTRT